MRDDSGKGESTNNNLDPTLKEHAGGKGPAQRSAGLPEQDNSDIVGNVKLKGEDPSPDDRARGETSSKEPAAPTDL